MSLVNGATQTEIQRGLVFYCPCTSQEDILKRGGTITGTPVFNNKEGILLDGSTDYIQFPHTVEVDFSIQSVTDWNFTLSTWINTSATARSSLFCKYASSNGWYLDMFTGGTIRCAYESNGGGNYRYRDSSSTINNGTWHFVAATYDRVTDTINIYIDGVLDQTSQVNGGTVTDADGTSVIEIGGNRSPGTYLAGSLKDVKIFNTALTAQEISDMYNNETYRYEDKCVLNLPMTAETHDPTEVRTLDVSGNNNHGTFGDGSTSTTYPTKLSKKGYSFDGGDYLNVGTPIYSGTNPYSIVVLFSIQGSTSLEQTLYAEGNSSNSFSLLIIRVDDATNKIEIHLRDDSGNDLISKVKTDIDPADNTIHSMIFTDNAGNGKMYIDGILDTADFSYTPGTVTLNTSAIGALIRSSIGTYVTGNIYDVQQYNFVLTPTQVIDLHNKLIKQINDI